MDAEKGASTPDKATNAEALENPYKGSMVEEAGKAMGFEIARAADKVSKMFHCRADGEKAALEALGEKLENFGMKADSTPKTTESDKTRSK